MRIPGINQTGVPGAEQLSLGAISSAAQAKMRTTQALTKVVSDYQVKVQRAETDEEYSRLSNGFARDTNSAWEEIKGQARVDENGAPTYDQMMDQYTAAHDKISKDYNGRVKFQPNKSAFSQFADSTLTRNSNTVSGEVGRRTVAHLSGAYEQSKVDYMNNPNGLEEFAMAQQAAEEGGLINPGQRVADYDAFQHEHHTNRMMSEFQTERDMGRGQEYLDGMAFPDTFDEGEQQRIIDQISQDLRNDQTLELRAAAKVKQEATLLNNQIVDAAKKGKVLLDSGRTITQDQLSQINKTIGQLTDPEQIEQMSISLEVYNNVQTLMSMTQEERTVAINETLEDVTDNRDLSIKQSTQKAVAAIEGAISRDPHAAWVMYGAGESMEAITKDNLVESLVKVQSNQSGVEAWTGKPAPPMSRSQLNDIIRLGPAAVDEILTAYGQEDAKPVLNLLYQEGAGEMAVVGSLALQSDGEASYSAYFIGAKILKGNPDYMLGNEIGKNNDSARSLYHEYTAGLFQFSSEAENTKASKSMQMVANTIYAGFAKKAQLKPGALDSELYKQAMELAVGKVIDYKGRKILLPGRGWTEAKLDDEIKNLTKERVVSMGGFASTNLQGRSNKTNLGPALKGSDLAVSPDQMLIKLKSGEAKLRQGSEFGHFQVWFGNRIVDNAAGEPFILDFSEK